MAIYSTFSLNNLMEKAVFNGQQTRSINLNIITKNSKLERLCYTMNMIMILLIDISKPYILILMGNICEFGD